MKILLINPLIRDWAKPNCFPLGLGYLASLFMAKGHEVEVFDINALRWTEEEIENKIKDADYDIVGIGAIVTVYKNVKWLISLSKKYHPDKPIVIGGSVGTSIPHIILEKTEADIVCIGEGEVTMPELIEVIQSNGDLSSVDGIWFKGKDGEILRNKNRPSFKDMDSIPLPAWDLFPTEIYLKNPVGAPNRNKWEDGTADSNDSVLSMNLSGTRGCPYKCIYCYHDFMGHGYRHRSPGNIAHEIRVLNEKYGVEYFHFVDDEFCLKSDFVYDFCQVMKREFNDRITWGCSGRVNLMTEDLIATMVDAGCVLIAYGIESGSQKMLDVMKKAVTVEQAKNAIKLTKKYLGWADCSFLIGTPGENRQTVQETIDFCNELDLTPEVIFFTTPYPGTQLYKMALAQGKIKDEEEYVLNLGEQGESVKVNFTDFPDDELLQIQEDMINKLNAWNKTKHSESR